MRDEDERSDDQYHRHLAELVTDLAPRNQLKFAATQYFRCLPPVGRLPAAAIDTATFTQAYFPPAMTVELSAVVEDEIPALLEDAVNLPPIDLVGEDEDFDHTRIHVLVPLPASKLDSLRLTAVTPPKLLLHWERGAVVAPSLRALETTPEWAKPIVACALQLSSTRPLPT